MKKYLSVFALAARSSFWKGLAVTLTSVALAGILLQLVPVERYGNYSGADFGTDHFTVEYTLAWGEIIKPSGAAIPLALGFSVLCGILALSGWGKGTQSGYTIQRLQVKEKTVLFLWSGYNFMMIVLFWAAAAGGMLLGMVLRAKSGACGGEIDPMQLILICYESPLLHHLLPGGDWIYWVGTALGAVACAMGCADVAYKKWNGESGGVALGVALALTLGSFFLGLESSGIQLLFALAELGAILLIKNSWWGGKKIENFRLEAE